VTLRGGADCSYAFSFVRRLVNGFQVITMKRPHHFLPRRVEYAAAWAMAFDMPAATAKLNDRNTI